MRRNAVCFLAGVTLTGAAIAIAGQGSAMLLAGLVVAIAAQLAALVAIGPGRVASFLAAIEDALQAAPAPGDDFTETRAEVLAALVADGAEYDDADAAVSQTAQTGPCDRRAWLRRSRALLKGARPVTRIDTCRRISD